MVDNGYLTLFTGQMNPDNRDEDHQEI